MSTLTIKSDAQIKADVLDELKWDPHVDETEVGVQVKDGVVTLTGNVTAYAKRIAARDAAHRVWGVHDVVDNLAVRIPTLLERTDEDLAKAVRHALKWDVFVPEERINSTVSNGVVTLEGDVESWVNRASAERCVQQLTGAKGVINRITVAAKPIGAGQIKLEIERALERQTEREVKRLHVAVKDGTVTITGTLRSWGEKNAMERAALFTHGVKRIDDRTKVDPHL